MGSREGISVGKDVGLPEGTSVGDKLGITDGLGVAAEIRQLGPSLRASVHPCALYTHV